MFTSYCSLSGEGKQKRDYVKSLINEKLLCAAHSLHPLCSLIYDAETQKMPHRFPTVISLYQKKMPRLPLPLPVASVLEWWLAAELNFFLPFRPETFATNLIVYCGPSPLCVAVVYTTLKTTCISTPKKFTDYTVCYLECSCIFADF